MVNVLSGADKIESLLHLDESTLAEIGRLRILAWAARGPLPCFAPIVGDSWIDSHDEHAHHWVIRRDGKVIAAARMCIHSTIEEMPDRECLTGLAKHIALPAASLNRLVVHPSCRGSHWGPDFDQVRIAAARLLGAKSVFVTTHPRSRIRDLQDIGFVILAESKHRIVPYLPSFVLCKVLEHAEEGA